MPRSRTLLVLLAVALPVVLVVAVLFLPGIAPPDPVTPSGRTINELYWVVFALGSVVFVLVWASLIAFLVRFRRRPETEEDVEGPQIHGNTRIEVVWTLVPAVLLLALAIFMFTRVPTVEATPPADADALRVEVTGRQFYWQYEYPNGALSYDVLYLPVDRPVTLALGTTDVIHSWWVPDFTGKLDAVPGRENLLNFTPEREGRYENGVCGEFCGIQHARMTTHVEVLSQEDFERWLSDNAPDQADLVALGEEQWVAACAKCHGLFGEGGIGVPIARNPTLVDAEALRPILFEGQNVETNPGYMPPVGKGWTDEQIQALIAYVEQDERLAPPGGTGGR